MQVTHVTPEFGPLIKAGGLGDVVYSLAKKLTQTGTTCDVLLPFYDIIPSHTIGDLKKTPLSLETEENGIPIPWDIYHGRYHGISLYLFSPHHPKEYFSRRTIYGETDDNDRFLLFSCAAAEFIKQRTPNACVHLHDWTVAILPYLLPHMKTILTIHNALFQGHVSYDNLKRVHLEHLEKELTPEGKNDPHLLVGGIEKADCITTVSPTYAEEIQTTFGFGLEMLYRKHKDKIHGILNGIDLDIWNPKTDEHIPHNYTIADPDVLDVKQKNKEALCKHFNKPVTDKPLFCSVTRLTAQKGPDLIHHAADHLMKKGFPFALSGTPSPDSEALFASLQKTYESSDLALLHFGFNEPLAHLIFAASDFIIIPSTFEPCGLTQMIALVYGCIPIVTSTGGLKDTIHELPEGNGIILSDHTNEAVDAAIAKALSYTKKEQTAFINKINPSHYSWEHSMQQYAKLYE